MLCLKGAPKSYKGVTVGSLMGHKHRFKGVLLVFLVYFVYLYCVLRLHRNDIHYLSLVFSLLFPRGREESVFWRCTVSQCLARTPLTYMSIRYGPADSEMSRDLYSGSGCISLSQCSRSSGTLLEVLCVYVNFGLEDLPHNPHCQDKRGDRTCLN